MAEERTVTQRLFGALVDRGLVTADQISHAQELHLQTRQPLGEVLVARGLVTPADVRSVLEDELGVPVVDLASYQPEASALRLVPPDVAKANRILPLFEIEGMLTVAVANPMDVFSFDELSAQLAYDLEPVLSEPAAITEAVETNYGGGPAAAEQAGEEPEPTEAAGPPAGAPQAEGVEAAAPDVAQAPAKAAAAPASDAEAAGAEAPAARAATAAAGAAPATGTIDLDVLAVADATTAVLLVTDIITAAKDAAASHVHVDPMGPEFELRFRVGDERRFIAKAAVSLESSLSRTIRTMARITAQPGQPATGHMRLFVRDQEVTVGVSLVPTIGGERLVMRLPGERLGPDRLDEAGFEDEDLAALRGLASVGGGLLLLAGPVRSGRSITMELLLEELAAGDRTVLSIEDRIERELADVWQIELAPATGLTATAALGAALRQDADVIGLDELRTAADTHMLLEAAAAGRLAVAATIGSDGCDTVARLIGGGVEAQSLAGQLVGIVSQRVLTATCAACRVEYTSDLAGRADHPGGLTTMRGEGCEACEQTGTAGRSAIFEVLAVGDALRQSIARGASAEALREAALRQGLTTLLSNGFRRVNEGVVTLEELDRAVPFATT